MNNNALTNILQGLLIIMGIVLFVLVIILVIVLIKKMQSTRNTTEKKEIAVDKEKEKKNASATAQYNKQSVFDFMEFDRVEDNMIIVKDGFKYLMVIECQGINYDLMSNLEKASVEQGFIQFLNTLRSPIQLYVQSRTVNLEGSISNYQARLDAIGKQLERMNIRYNEILNSRNRINEQELQRLQFEIAKQKNLYDYGVDIVRNTEKMSLNKNILRKYYYIIVPYYPEELSAGKYDKEEIKGIAFSELYTTCQSLIQSLGACSINGKILDSRQLVELLYVAYNRDESESFSLEKALNSGFTELYTTAPDILDKKMKELDNAISERAKILANNAIKEVALDIKREKEISDKEKNMETLANKAAKQIVDENKDLLGKTITDRTMEKLDEDNRKKGETSNEKTTKTRRATGKRK